MSVTIIRFISYLPAVGVAGFAITPPEGSTKEDPEIVVGSGRRGADQHQNKGGDLCRPTAQKESDDQSDPTHCQPVNGEGIEENMNVFRLPLERLKK